MQSKDQNILIIADSDRDADMLYGSGLFVPDPFILVRKRKQTHLVLSDLELDRAAKQCPQATIHSFTKLRSRTIRHGTDAPNLGHIAGQLLRQLRVPQITVPPTFPHQFAQALAEACPNVTLSIAPPFPERAIKTTKELRHLKQILKLTEDALQAGIDFLRKTKIEKDGRLTYQKRVVTSEQVRAVIHSVICQNGGVPCHTIVAGGNQACDPHERGHGPLKAHRPIIIDVFPRSEHSGYFGDLTRTVVRGKASERVRQMYAAVGQAQQVAMKAIRDGQACQPIHQAVVDEFEALGFPTRRHKGHMEGFFHGTGHGLGLEIHEGPGIGRLSNDTLQTNHVVTVEPGLYYPGTGGIRLEDVVVVQKRGAKRLTNLPHQLEI